MREFELIQALGQRLAPRRADTLLGIGDDAALLDPPAGQALVVTTDTLIAGRHFPHDTSAFDIGYKALTVNLSDLAAMAAEPAWCTLSLAAPALDDAWCAALLDGAQAAVGDASVDIVGGDTTQSDVLTLGVTALGFCPPDQAIRRDGARVGDVIAVTGTLGDAAAGLSLWSEREAGADAHVSYLLSRLCRPSWRRGEALRGLVHAAVDISDGLCADLEHILAASGVGTNVSVDKLPTSQALRSVVTDCRRRQRMQLTGGDDYELCLTLPAAHVDTLAARLGCGLTVIGEVVEGQGVSVVDEQQRVCSIEAWGGEAGWDHFS